MASPDNGERLLPDLFSWSEIIRTIQIAVVHLRPRHEGIDVYGVRAFDPNLVDFFVLDLNVLALADLVPAPDVLLVHRFTRFRVDHLLLEPVASCLVNSVERNSLGRRRSRIERYRT